MPKCDEMCRKCGKTDGVCMITKLCGDCADVEVMPMDIELGLFYAPAPIKGALIRVKQALEKAQEECFEDSEYYVEFQQALADLDAFIAGVPEEPQRPYKGTPESIEQTPVQNKIKIHWREWYEDCDHAGCSGGERYHIKIELNGKIVSDEELGGCFGSTVYDQLGAIWYVLNKIGFEIEPTNIEYGEEEKNVE